MKSSAKRNYIFYVLMLLIFGVLFWMVIQQGKLWDVASEKALSATSEQAVPSATVSEHTSSAPYVLLHNRCLRGCTIRLPFCCCRLSQFWWLYGSFRGFLNIWANRV